MFTWFLCVFEFVTVPVAWTGGVLSFAPPVMSFRPRGGNARRKQRTAVDSDDDDADEVAKKLTKAKSAPKPAVPAKSLAKLSVDDEDGEEIFKKKKKGPRPRGASFKADVPLSDTDGQNGQAGGSSYSAAALSDLKSQTPQMPSNFAEKNRGAKSSSHGTFPELQFACRPALQTVCVLMSWLCCTRGETRALTTLSAGPAVLKISGSFRSNVSAKSHESAMPETFKLPAQANTASHGIPPPSAPPAPPSVGSSRSAAADTSGAAKGTSKQGAAGSNAEEGQSDDDDGDFCIPTAELIQKAKEKRLRLRGAHMAPGYVPSDHPDFKPLKEFKKTEDAVKKGSDNDSSDDEPEDDIRLKFSGGVPDSKSLREFQIIAWPGSQPTGRVQCHVLLSNCVISIDSFPGGRYCFARNWAAPCLLRPSSFGYMCSSCEGEAKKAQANSAVGAE